MKIDCNFNTQCHYNGGRGHPLSNQTLDGGLTQLILLQNNTVTPGPGDKAIITHPPSHLSLLALMILMSKVVTEDRNHSRCDQGTFLDANS